MRKPHVLENSSSGCTVVARPLFWDLVVFRHFWCRRIRLFLILLYNLLFTTFHSKVYPVHCILCLVSIFSLMKVNNFYTDYINFNLDYSFLSLDNFPFMWIKEKWMNELCLWHTWLSMTCIIYALFFFHFFTFSRKIYNGLGVNFMWVFVMIMHCCLYKMMWLVCIVSVVMDNYN